MQSIVIFFVRWRRLINAVLTTNSTRMIWFGTPQMHHDTTNSTKNPWKFSKRLYREARLDGLCWVYNMSTYKSITKPVSKRCPSLLAINIKCTYVYQILVVNCLLRNEKFLVFVFTYIPYDKDYLIWRFYWYSHNAMYILYGMNSANTRSSLRIFLQVMFFKTICYVNWWLVFRAPVHSAYTIKVKHLFHNFHRSTYLTELGEIYASRPHWHTSYQKSRIRKICFEINYQHLEPLTLTDLLVAFLPIRKLSSK